MGPPAARPSRSPIAFSIHIAHTLRLTNIIFFLMIEKYLIRWFCASWVAYVTSVALMGLLVVTQMLVLIATKRHYTVDVLLAAYIAPMHWYFFETRWPDPPAQGACAYNRVEAAPAAEEMDAELGVEVGAVSRVSSTASCHRLLADLVVDSHAHTS